ncbi:MAG: hypothetical protein GXP62_03690 [Oligoflexia bacterium]|nr:hypothetical protein [Oligoflexia bacterium]
MVGGTIAGMCTPAYLTLFAVLATACTPELPLTLEISPAVSTVVIANWTTPAPSLGRVLWGLPGGDQQVTAEIGEPRTQHRLAIAGLHSDTSYRFQVQVENSTNSWSSLEQNFATGVLPTDLADFQVKGDAQAFPGYLPLALFGSGSGVSVIDASGEIVWYYQLFDPSWSARRVWYVPEQRCFVVSIQSLLDGTHLLWISLDGTQVREIVVDDLDHDFLVLPGGELLMIVEDGRVVDGQEIAGNALVRMDADGNRTTLWSIWDLYDLDDQPAPPNGDWTHANALDYLPQRDLVLLGLRHFDSILALNAADYSLQWALGGANQTIKVDEDVIFHRQHQFQLLNDDHILVFDNQAGPDSTGDSRVLELALDLENKVASGVWEHHHVPSLFSDILGNVEALPNGDRLVTWSMQGQVQVVEPDDSIAWQLDMLLGTAITYGDRFDSF